MTTERTIYSPREACDVANCGRGYILSLERSQTLIPHRHDIPSENPNTRPLVYYDLTQVQSLVAAVKLRHFIEPKYMRKLLREERFLLVCDQLIELFESVECKGKPLIEVLEESGQLED